MGAIMVWTEQEWPRGGNYWSQMMNGWGDIEPLHSADISSFFQENLKNTKQSPSIHSTDRLRQKKKYTLPNKVLCKNSVCKEQVE